MTESWSEIIGKCDKCGEIAPVKKMRDPYIEELHPKMDNPCENWCEMCYHEACDDI